MSNPLAGPQGVQQGTGGLTLQGLRPNGASAPRCRSNNAARGARPTAVHADPHRPTAIRAHPLGARGVLNGKKKKVFRYQFSQKSPRALHVLNHGSWRLAVGGWWRLAVGNWRLVAVGGGWRWLVAGGWWLEAVGSGWQLAVGRRWRLAAVGGWRLVVGGWWRLAVDGSWRLAVGGPLGRSLRAVLSKKKTKKNLVP